MNISFLYLSARVIMFVHVHVGNPFWWPPVWLVVAKEEIFIMFSRLISNRHLLKVATHFEGQLFGSHLSFFEIFLIFEFSE